jgi:hypothetical protein
MCFGVFCVAPIDRGLAAEPSRANGTSFADTLTINLGVGILSVVIFSESRSPRQKSFQEKPWDNLACRAAYPITAPDRAKVDLYVDPRVKVVVTPAMRKTGRNNELRISNIKAFTRE